MTRSILSVAFALTAAVALNVASTAKAQVSFGFGGPTGGASVTIGGGNRFSGNHTTFRPSTTTVPVGWGRPSRPVYVTPSQITGYNPWTGAVHTHNNQVNDTAFDFGRNASQHNGTRRYVNRPVRDSWGNIIGYERGYVWNNSFTGQEHGETTIVRPNGTGGTDSTTVVRSMAPPASSSPGGSPGNSHSTQLSYAPTHKQP